MIGTTAKDGVANRLRTTAIANVVANGKSAARVAYQNDLRGACLFLDGFDFVTQCLHVLVGRRAASLRFVIGIACKWVGDIDSMQKMTRPSIGFKSPKCGLPKRSRVAVAVDEDDGLVHRLRCGN